MNKILPLLMIMMLLLTACSLGLGKEAPKKTILVVSFGTSYNENRALTLDAIEEAIAKTLS